MRRNSIVWSPIVVSSLIGICGCGAGSQPEDLEAVQELVTHYDVVFKEHLAEANREIGKIIVQYEPLASDVIPRKVKIQGDPS